MGEGSFVQSRDFLARLDAYYTQYYRDALGFSDYKERCNLRHIEVQQIGMRTIKYFKDASGSDPCVGRTLVVGCGSGAELAALFLMGGNPFGVEPSSMGVQLSHERLLEMGMDPEHVYSNVRQGYAEELPWESGYFDAVICYTVLEHVQDVKGSLREMVRVTKHGGKIFLCLPDYRFPWEGHYKMWMPTMLPKFILALYLRLRKRPASFLQSINFLTAPQLDRIFYDLDIVFSRYVVPQKNPNFLFELYRSFRNVHQTQFVILHL